MDAFNSQDSMSYGDDPPTILERMPSQLEYTYYTICEPVCIRLKSHFSDFSVLSFEVTDCFLAVTGMDLSRCICAGNDE
jgi:hypothetical protein